MVNKMEYPCTDCPKKPLCEKTWQGCADWRLWFKQQWKQLHEKYSKK